MHVICQYPAEPGLYPTARHNEVRTTIAEQKGINFCNYSCYVNRTVIARTNEKPQIFPQRMNLVPPNVETTKVMGVSETYTIQLRSGEYELDLVFTEPIKDNPNGILGAL